MPVHRSKKCIIPNPTDSTEGQSTPGLPNQQEFQQYLREQARGAIRIVLEDVMREELDALIGVGWGESSRQQQRLSQWVLPARFGHVLGSARGSESPPRSRRPVSHAGVRPLQPLRTADCPGTDRDVCSWREYTTSVGEVAETLMGVAPSASTISRLNRDLEQQFTAWRERRLQEHWRILYLDGIHFSVRHGDQADTIVILTVLGVDMAGTKEVLALRACAEESKDGWVSVLEDLRARGATQIDLIVTDAAPALSLAQATQRPECYPQAGTS